MIIGNRYFIEDPESGHYEVTKADYDAYHKRLAQFRAYFNPDRFVNPEHRMKPKIILHSNRPPGDEEDDFKNLWLEAEKYLPDFLKSSGTKLITYFQPTHQGSQFDKYGHAILPPRLGTDTDDAISAARLSFPKTEDEAFGD